MSKMLALKIYKIQLSKFIYIQQSNNLLSHDLKTSLKRNEEKILTRS